MALSIKNSQAEKLAREVTAISGESLTQAITHALEERLERLKGKRSATDIRQEIMAVSRRCSSLSDIDKRSPDEILGYNQSGIIE